MSAPPAERRRAAPPGPPKHVTEQEATLARKAIEKLEKVGHIVTRALMTIGSGALVFTCVNVTLFAMAHHVTGWVAWMLDPLASIALLTVLYVDGVLAEQGTYKASGWPFVLRWFAGMSTWLMNCWESLFPDGVFHLIPKHPDAGGILLHSVAPFLLITLAEASAGYRTYLAGRLKHYRQIIEIYEHNAHAEKDERERRAREEREEREREERERRLREDRDRQERETREHEARLERERREAEIELAERQRRTEIEAAREAARLEREREEIEEARRKREAEIEAERLRLQAQLEAEERDREAARQAEIIKAEAQARAEEERVRAEIREREAKRLQAAERRQRGRHAAPDGEVASASISSARASESGSRSGSQSSRDASESAVPLSPVLAAVASENGGRVPREVREKLRDEAERYVAKCLLAGETPDTEALAHRYDKGETWVGDRIRNARRRLAEEPGFEDEVIAAAIAEDSAQESAA